MQSLLIAKWLNAMFTWYEVSLSPRCSSQIDIYSRKKNCISDLWILKGKLVSAIKMYSLDNFRRADILKLEKYI